MRDELLRQPVYGHHADGNQIGQTLDQTAICHDKGETQPRHEGQRKGVNVDDIILRIERFDRRQLFACVNQLRSRVLLDDRNPVAIGDFDHFFAPLQGKDASCRIVKAGVDVDQLRLMCRHQPLKRVHIHAVLVNRHRHNVCACQLHRAVSVRRYRLLHDNRITGLKQKHDNEIERLIGLCENLNLSGRGVHALRAEQRHDLLTEHAVALERAVKILCSALLRNQRRQDTRQFFFVVNTGAGDAAAHRDDMLVTEALKQIVKGDLHVLVFVLDTRFPVDLFLFGLLLRGAAVRLHPRPLRGFSGVHQITDTLPRIYQLLCFEFVICLCDSIAMYAHLLCHQAFGGQHAARCALAGEDLRFDLIRQSAVDRNLVSLLCFHFFPLSHPFAVPTAGFHFVLWVSCFCGGFCPWN